jgi:Transglycosylase SLT domain
MRRLLTLLTVVVPTVAVASPPPSPSAQCDTAIVGAERSQHLPFRLLGAIAEVESGRPDPGGKVRPWPWTINVEGRGEFFASKQQAIEAVRAVQAQGVRSIDVGCMQANLMHHPNAFASLDAAFDPTANAIYAARFLNTLYGGSGSWVQATAAYHSQTPAIGADYQQRVMARWDHPRWDQQGRPFGVPATQAAYRNYKTARVYGAFQPTQLMYRDFAKPAPAPTRLAHR